MALLAIPAGERAERCIVETDFCMIDEADCYVRALLEIPIIGFDRAFVWMVWASLSKSDFFRLVETFEEPKRSHIGPFCGRLDSPLPVYRDCRNLAVTVHPRDDFLRPSIELGRSDHLLAVEQHRGMSVDRVAEIVGHLERASRL